MSVDTLIKWSNRILLFSIGLLVYWVFIFSVTVIFGLKVLAENATQAFALSILGLLALAAGATVMSISANLTKISNHVARGAVPLAASPRKGRAALLLILSFPLIAAVLFAADQFTTHRKKAFILESAQSLATNNADWINELGAYEFSRAYINGAREKLALLEKQDEDLPAVSVITQDDVRGKTMFMEFGSRSFSISEAGPKKEEFIFSPSLEERAYLTEVFSTQDVSKMPTRFSAHDGFYELFYPVKTERGIIVLYLSDRAAYGKISS